MPVARTHFLCHCYHHIPGKPADLLSCWYCIPVGHTSSPPEPTGRRSSKSGRSYWHALTVDDDHYRHHFPYGYATDSRKIRRCMSPAQCYRSCCLSHAVSRQKGPACHPALHAVNSVGFHCTSLMCQRDTFGQTDIFPQPSSESGSHDSLTVIMAGFIPGIFQPALNKPLGLCTEAIAPLLKGWVSVRRRIPSSYTRNARG